MMPWSASVPAGEDYISWQPVGTPLWCHSLTMHWALIEHRCWQSLDSIGVSLSLFIAHISLCQMYKLCNCEQHNIMTCTITEKPNKAYTPLITKSKQQTHLVVVLLALGQEECAWHARHAIIEYLYDPYASTGKPVASSCIHTSNNTHMVQLHKNAGKLCAGSHHPAF